MENKFIIEDVYEPIHFQMKNLNGEIFDCVTKFRNTDTNVEIEKLSKLPSGIKLSKDGEVISIDENDKEPFNERLKKGMVLMAGKTPEFWGQFSQQAIIQTIKKINELETEKYKKKPVMK
jgi:hypothetical protein